MSDIFISYSKADHALALELSAFLESEGWTVWWDKSLAAADLYQDEIMKQLTAARAVITIWTENSIKSDWVRAEAGRAKADGKLIPVKTSDVAYADIPLPFGEMHTENIGSTDLLRAAVIAQLAKPAHLWPADGGPRRRWWRPLGKRYKHGKPAQVPIPAQNIVKSEYVVWYGTNRRRYDESDLTKGYSAERDSKVHYGSCRVYIPEAHKIGSLGSPWWKRLITRTDDRLKLREIKEADNTSFWHQIALRLSKLSVAERHAVIFVHGYNVSFHDAALRAAQIGVDLSIKGTMAFFSWPSQGLLGGYTAVRQRLKLVSKTLPISCSISQPAAEPKLFILLRTAWETGAFCGPSIESHNGLSKEVRCRLDKSSSRRQMWIPLLFVSFAVHTRKSRVE